MMIPQCEAVSTSNFTEESSPAVRLVQSVPDYRRETSAIIPAEPGTITLTDCFVIVTIWLLLELIRE